MTSEQIVAEVQRKWSQGFAAQNVEALVALYAADGMLFGSKPDLSVGRAGVRDYFGGFAPGMLKSAAFSQTRVVALGADAIATAGFINFTVLRDGQLENLAYRISFTLQKHGEEWLIVSHHASPRAATI